MDFFSCVKAQWETLPVLLKREHVAGGTFIITGSNHGIGREAARHVAELGAARLILADVVEVWVLDMTDFAGIRAFAARYNSELVRIDGLVQNAAVAVDRFDTNKEGYEISVAGNVIGPALLTLLLLSKSKETTRRFNVPPHVVMVTSQKGFTTPQVMVLVDQGLFEALNQDGLSPMSDRYAVSKLVDILLFRELAKLLPFSSTGTVINLISPGLCNTGLARNSHSLAWRAQIWFLNLLIGRTAEMGSRAVLHAMMAGEESHDAFLSDCQIKEHWVPDWAKYEEGEVLQKNTWDQFLVVLESLEPGCLNRALEARDT
ncbi:hypothetical protein ACHAQH_008407 [Verticillium albo-atrum]